MPTLHPGDVMLYTPSSVYGTLIRIKTWHNISHVEIFLGNGESSASRDGIGVGIYPVRTDHLAVIMRPKGPFDAARARYYTEAHKGLAYGWSALLNFVGIPVKGHGIVCSPWVTCVLRDNGIAVFNNDPMELIAPFEFLDSELLWEAWRA